MRSLLFVMETGNQKQGTGNRVSAIIVAAGSSRRMGFDKLLAPLAGTPVLLRTLRAFENCSAVDEIIVVAGGEVAASVDRWKSELAKLKCVVEGGAQRHLSVWNGLNAVSPQAEIVAVHDGGRPLITSEQIAKCVAGAREMEAIACARPVTETLKRADAAGCIAESIDRAGAWIMETPQVFKRDLLVRAYEKVMREHLLVTDEVSAVQALGSRVHVIENTAPNLKITFPADLALAEKLLA